MHRDTVNPMKRKNRDGHERGPRRQGRHFMDAAMDGYIRDLALDKWREVDDMVDTLDKPLHEAVDAVDFIDREPYRKLWMRWWQAEVLGHKAHLSTDNLMERIEAAARGALRDEREQRLADGAPTIEDTAQYQAFVSRAMGVLLEEAQGEIEDIEEEGGW